MAVTRRQVVDGAVRGVLAAHFKDYDRGLIDFEDLAEQAQRRRDAIRSEFRATVERLRQRVSACAGCGRGATTVIAGRPYCNACTSTAPRLADPRGVA